MRCCKDSDGGPQDTQARPAGRSWPASSAVAVAMIARRLDRHRTARPAAGPAQRRTLHADHDRRGVARYGALSFAALLVLWFRTAAFGARRLAHGRDVRLAVRHRAVGDRQRRAVRSRLLCRPALRALRRQLRAGGAADRQCRLAGPDCPPARHAAPAGRVRTRPPHRARAAVQRGRRILQRRHHHQVARRHHHRLEPGRRTAVRIYCGRSGRPATSIIIVPPDRRDRGARHPRSRRRRRTASRSTKPCGCTRTAARWMSR